MSANQSLTNIHQKSRAFIDILCVIKFPFLNSIPEGERLREWSSMTSLTKVSLKDAVSKIIKAHKNGGCQIKCIGPDAQFDCDQDELEISEVGMAGADGHAKKLKRTTRVAKEGSTGLAQGFPFKRAPRIMARILVETAVKNLRYLPAENGSPGVLRTLPIVLGGL